jgi:hypothetical protein
MKKILTVFAVFLIAAATAQAGMVKSISATNVGTSYVGSAGALTMGGVGGINVEYSDGTSTYVAGSFSLNTTLVAGGDHSSSGIASGSFAGGSFLYQDAGHVTLLSGNITSFALVETYDNSGLFWGEGLFTVTGGSLQTDFGYASGTMVDISFSVVPKTIGDFSTSFTASSNMTVLPVPEPVTIGLLSLGSLVILQKRKHS